MRTMVMAMMTHITLPRSIIIMLTIEMEMMTLVVATMTMTSPMIHADTHLPYASLNDQ